MIATNLGKCNGWPVLFSCSRIISLLAIWRSFCIYTIEAINWHSNLSFLFCIKYKCSVGKRSLHHKTYQYCVSLSRLQLQQSGWVAPTTSTAQFINCTFVAKSYTKLKRGYTRLRIYYAAQKKFYSVLLLIGSEARVQWCEVKHAQCFNVKSI